MDDESRKKIELQLPSRLGFEKVAMNTAASVFLIPLTMRVRRGCAKGWGPCTRGATSTGVANASVGPASIVIPHDWQGFPASALSAWQ